MTQPLSTVVLAGGQGKRLGFDGPKVLAPLCGAPSLAYVMDAIRPLGSDRTVVVVCYRKADVESFLIGRQDGAIVVDQKEPLGTGHAVLATAEELKDQPGDVLVLFGDGPLIRQETLEALVARHRGGGAAATITTTRMPDPTGYGRILKDASGALARVVEEKDADAETRRVDHVHCGIAMFDRAALFDALAHITPDNAQSEYYLTDVYPLMQERGGRVDLHEILDPDEVLGFNRPSDLADCRSLVRRRILEQHMANGVEIEDPDKVFVDRDVQIGSGTRLLPFTVIHGPARIGRNCEVGPFSHLRAGSVMADGAEVGNFVEVKNSELREGVKAKHLTYLGDTFVGAETNIGAGTITANYDGKNKHRTEIGRRAFIGSGSILVAPVKVGDEGVTGAGAVVTRGRDVAPGTTVIGVPARPLLKNREA